MTVCGDPTCDKHRVEVPAKELLEWLNKQEDLYILTSGKGKDDKIIMNFLFWLEHKIT